MFCKFHPLVLASDRSYLQGQRSEIKQTTRPTFIYILSSELFSRILIITKLVSNEAFCLGHGLDRVAVLVFSHSFIFSIIHATHSGHCWQHVRQSVSACKARWLGALLLLTQRPATPAALSRKIMPRQKSLVRNRLLEICSYHCLSSRNKDLQKLKKHHIYGGNWEPSSGQIPRPHRRHRFDHRVKSHHLRSCR